MKKKKPDSKVQQRKIGPTALVQQNYLEYETKLPLNVERKDAPPLFLCITPSLHPLLACLLPKTQKNIETLF
jgi:hypothetical protein